MRPRSTIAARAGRGSRRLAAGLIAATALAGCTVGPDYHAPAIATPPAYSEAGTAKTAPISLPVPTEADLTQWWLQFNDPMLNWLIGRALAQNLNLQTAIARLRQSREAEIVANAAGLPHVSSTAAVARLNDNASSPLIPSITGQSGQTGGQGGIRTLSHLDLFAANFDATWEIDIFGQTRRSLEESRANTQASIWQHRDAEVSLTAEVANDYVMLRALQVQIGIAQNEAKTQQANFAIIQQQAKTGFVTRLNVNQQVAQVEATIAQIPQLQAQARAQVHALSVLLAMEPDALDDRLNAAGPLPSVPDRLPIGLPSDLLRRRPDIRRAERQLASATAAIGVEVGNLYPKFNILALGPAFASTTTDHLFDLNNATSVGVGLIQWPIFQGGATRAGIRSARAQADQAYFAYKQAVLSALQNVEDDLARYSSAQLRILPLRRSATAAENSLTIANQQYQVGLVTYINILQAQATLLNAQNQLAQANADLAQDLASLYTALGGGWSADEGAGLRRPGVSWP